MVALRSPYVPRSREAGGSWLGRGHAGTCVAVVLLLAVSLLVVMESHFIYFPARELVARPADFGLEADELRLSAADGVGLHGWWIRGRGRAAVVWFHGNAGNVSHRLDNARELVARFGLDLFLVDYRGYGLSEGEPSEAGLYADGMAVYDEARARGFAPPHIVLFGRSLGAAVAIEVALAREARGLILETPFRSIRAMAHEHVPFVPGFLIRSRYDSEAKVGRLSLPLLVLHGDRDDIVPLPHAQRLFDLAPGPKRFFLIRGAGHNDTYVAGGEAYFGAWHTFLDSLSLNPEPLIPAP
jgi:fermentation-respiration switch protein FrsA (DUF1100 family)